MSKQKKEEKSVQVENTEYACPSCGRKSVVEGKCQRCKKED